MKKVLKFLMCGLFSIAFLLLPVVIFAQGTDLTLPVNGDLGTYVATFTAYVATVIFLTGVVAGIIKNLSGPGKQYLSWLVAIIVGYAAYFLKLGIFSGIVWWQVLVYAATFAFGANGIVKAYKSIGESASGKT